MIEDKYRLMCMQLIKHRFLYYVLAEPEISDHKYDAMEKELMQFEEEHPELVHEKSPTKTVGSDNIESYPSGLVSLYRDHPKVIELMGRQGLKWITSKKQRDHVNRKRTKNCKKDLSNENKV